MNIIPELNLNRHPKDCKCNSLVLANNLRLSNDLSCLQSEESIKANAVINNYLAAINNEGKIIGTIPCNKELIIFYTIKNSSHNKYTIVRYNEELNQCKKYYNQDYFNGVIKGDFTYNSLGELIIAFCESSENENIMNGDSPLKTINLGKFKDNYIELSNDALVLNPAPNFVNIEQVRIVDGYAKKGWYTFFIRYKIDDTNYTKWHDLGYPIYLNGCEERSIIKLYNTFKYDAASVSLFTLGIGCTDYVSDDEEIVNKTISFAFDIKESIYKKYQIGWICSNKTSTNAYKTFDFNIKLHTNFKLSYNNSEEYAATEFFQGRINYYNVKNIINYKNRLYIAGYKEHYDNIDYFSEYVNKIALGVNITTINLGDSYQIENNKLTACVDKNGKLSTSNTDSITYIDASKTFNGRISTPTLIPGNLYKFYIHFVDKYGEYTDGIEIPFNENTVGFTKKIINNEDYFELTCPNVLYEEEHKVKVFKLTAKLTEEISIPNGYITTFLSYEKIEQNQITGILCKYDFNDNSYGFDKPNDELYHFYTNELDIKDKLNINFTELRVDKKHIYGLSSFISTKTIALLKGYIFGESIGEDFADKIHVLNASEVFETPDNVEYIDLSNVDIKLKLGGDGKNGRDGIGTCIELSGSKIDAIFDNIYSAHKVTLIGNPSISNYKELIKFTNWINLTTTETIINGAYNGFITFNSAFIYNANKVILNDVNNGIYDTNGTYYIPSAINPLESKYDPVDYKLRKPILNIQYAQYGEIMFETKSFKKEPDSLVILYEFNSTSDKYQPATKIGYFVKPINSIDLYKDECGRIIDNCQKFLTNYSKEYKYLTEFNKIIRRSAVIGDESQINSWRNFPLESYVLINENKGNITNIIGLGNTLLVHTEHSLFMFNSDARLRNTDSNDVQISNPDIFDVAYQEVFTSKLGSCGLQDREAFVVDDFGYIFYDNDANKIYNFSSKSIEEIDNTIINWLKIWQPNKIRFANDKESNRILLEIWYNDNDKLTLSYNFVTKTFVSIHNYNFDKSTRTKNILYYLYNNKFYNINYSNKNREYNIFENNDVSEPSINSLAIIYNNQYELIKALEFITYKLYKSYDNNEDLIAGAIKHKEPYSGNTLQILNDLVSTEIIDISIDSNEVKNLLNNWKKPYWDLGNWNFNYIRDIRNGSTSDTMSRIYGNYFVLIFVFGGTNVKYEFESLDCAITKFR